jgi:hypothetical protein
VDSAKVRVLVETYYDVQQLRLASQNRIRAAVGHGLHEESAKELLDFVDEHMEVQESRLKGMVQKQIGGEPLWKEWLSGVKGVGPCIAGGLMAWLGDCSQFETVSKVWAFCGMHVLNGEAPKRKRGQKVNWNPTLRTLCWKAGKSFVMVGDGYRALYEQEKTRLRGLHPKPVEWHLPRKKKDGSPWLRFTDGHVDAMARRKVAKVFLAHYWQKAREQAGLPTRAVYCVEHLGHTTQVPVVHV